MKHSQRILLAMVLGFILNNLLIGGSFYLSLLNMGRNLDADMTGILYVLYRFFSIDAKVGTTINGFLVGLILVLGALGMLIGVAIEEILWAKKNKENDFE